MAQPLGVIEDIETTPRRPLFETFGIPWEGTPLAWAAPLFYLPLGLAVALVDRRGKGRFGRASIYTALMVLTNYTHSLGHVISSKASGAPMDAVLVTATRHINLYHGEQAAYPKRVHVVRSLGGPLANLVMGLLMLPRPGWIARAFAWFNLLSGIGALAPVETVDGGVIWREMAGWQPPADDADPTA